MGEAKARYVNSDEFFDLRAESSLFVVDCTASWCGPCKLVAPLIDRLADSYADKAVVVKLDMDNNRPVAKEFEIRSIPAVLFFKDGELIDKVIGVSAYEVFSETLEKLL